MELVNNLPNFTSPLSVRRMFAPCRNTIVFNTLEQFEELEKVCNHDWRYSE